MSVTIPSGLPASDHAVLRWEWYSLQQGPTTPEFYANCVDIEITSTVAEGGPLPTPRCTMGGWLPIGATGSYRNAYGRGAQFITGPKVASFGAVTPCVTPTTFQCAFNDLTCDCGSSSAATRACPGTTMNPPVGGATAAPSAPPTTLASCAAFSNADCQTHTVNAGDTLSGIVAQAKWTKAPYTVVTVAQVASINGIVDPSSVDVGDTLTIPQVCACDHLYYLPTHMHMHMHTYTHTFLVYTLLRSPLSPSPSRFPSLGAATRTPVTRFLCLLRRKTAEAMDPAPRQVVRILTKWTRSRKASQIHPPLSSSSSFSSSPRSSGPLSRV